MSWRLHRPGALGQPPFEDTLPIELQDQGTTTPFTEPVEGMSVREISDDDLFVHLFGKDDAE